MKTLLRYILLAISVLFLTCNVSAQDRAAMEAEISRYEDLCRSCLELKARIASGETIPRKTAADMIDSFVSMSTVLKAKRSAMTVVQRQRFDAVRIWFATGERPQMYLNSSHEPVVLSFNDPVVSDVPSCEPDLFAQPAFKQLRKWDLMSKYILTDFAYP